MELIADFAMNYGLFLAKAVTVVIALALAVGWILSLIGQARAERDGDRLSITHVNDRLDRMAETLNATLLNDSERKARAKRKKVEDKQQRKAEKLGKRHEPARLFVLDFDGDIRASAVESLRDEITAVMQVAEAGDEVLVRLESAGGMVHSYGLAASQLARLRDAGVRLTICVDRLAASGGYMMACVGERIVAAPFSIIGSIGVVAQIPNFHRLLKDKQIDFEMHTAGDYKRTLTVFGENTEEGRAKFREELEDTHGLFKHFVSRYRPNLDIDRVATGEHWYGSQALTLALVDEVATSDDVMLTAARDGRDVFTVAMKHNSGFLARIAEQSRLAISRSLSESGLAKVVHRAQ
ncbi:protease SohB [Salinisphaera sp.]|uniref:protease SohB n=1 Tax=Salinisphaera sp. TaxID=1914330 RepID=UPI000C610DD7|nr:protease SohB [Salinisphaera sp.]MBS63818.1 protease SohB [Salinisphaera sp.]